MLTVTALLLAALLGLGPVNATISGGGPPVVVDDVGGGGPAGITTGADPLNPPPPVDDVGGGGPAGH